MYIGVEEREGKRSLEICAIYYYSLSGNDDVQVVGVEKTGERYVSCVYRYICIYHVHICGIILYHL